MYYVHVAPPDSVRGPPYIPHPPHSIYPVATPDALALRANVVKQIEYYFRWLSNPVEMLCPRWAFMCTSLLYILEVCTCFYCCYHYHYFIMRNDQVSLIRKKSKNNWFSVSGYTPACGVFPILYHTPYLSSYPIVRENKKNGHSYLCILWMQLIILIEVSFPSSPSLSGRQNGGTSASLLHLSVSTCWHDYCSWSACSSKKMVFEKKRDPLKNGF